MAQEGSGMRITYELNLKSFNARGDAAEVLGRIRREGKCGELESILETRYPGGMSENELNRLLWLDSDAVYGWLGMKTDTELEEEEQGRLAELLDKAREAETFEDFCACFGDCDDCPLFGGFCDTDAYEKWKEDYV